MARRWWKWLLLVAIVLPFLVWCSQTIRWVGSTDLQVEFTVTDAATGGSILGARIEVQSEDEPHKQEFVLVTDVGGLAHKECPNSMCFGTRGAFTDTFVVHLPWWRFRVVADGYEPGEWMDLDVLEYRRQVRRAGPGRAELAVPVSLNKRHAEPL